MLELMNELPELVYVADIDTYELLFANTAGKQKFGLENPEGQKCYRVLQGLDSPCPFCTNSKLSLDEVYTWEHTNPRVNSHYLLKDKLVEWGGKKARLEIAFDITQQINEKKALEFMLSAEHTVMECVRMLYGATDLTPVCMKVLERIGRFWMADRVYLFEIQSNKMYNTLEWCAPGVMPEKDTLQGLDVSLIDRWVPYFNRQECVVVEDLEDLRESEPQEYRALSQQNIHSLVVAPMEHEGILVGFLGVDNPCPDRIQNVAPLFHTLRYFLMSAFQHAKNEERLIRLSYYDQLTGLFNRNRFMHDMQEAGTVHHIGVAHIDVNGLKAINDKQGHAAGDSVLVECARRLSACLKNAGCYRIGGDEFVAIWRNIPEAEFEEAVLELKERFAATSGCPTAIGTIWAAQTKSLQQLISEASERMYQDKKKFYRLTLSSDRYRHYNDDVLGLTNPEFLQQEMENGKFLVYLQPKLRFQDRELAGAEALVRYKMEDGTIAAPNQFIPILEDARLIGKLDLHMFGRVCALIASWRKRGITPLPTAVNFSRYSLLEKGFSKRLEAVCDEYGVQKNWLEIEITESVEGVEGFDVKTCLRELRQCGFCVSIDDFGARYANFYLFASTRFDVLKVDKSLVDDVTTNQNVLLMLEAICTYCKKLQIETVAEGVETEEQFLLLRKLGFQQAQGYLFSRPLPAGEYETRFLAGKKIE